MKNIGKAAIIIILASILALALNGFDFRAESLLMLYVVAIVIIIVETGSFKLGIVSALVCVFTFNFLFTEPRFTFSINDPNYYISMLIFLIVAGIVGSLMTRLKKQIIISTENEEGTKKLYKIVKGYLNLTGDHQITIHGEKSIQELTGKTCYMYLKKNGKPFESEGLNWCFDNSTACGFGEMKLGELPVKYMPIRSGHKTLGALEMEMEGTDLSKPEMVYVNTILTQTTIALERDHLSKEEEKNKFRIETERLKSNLLRSISHDLRTPLTSIEGSANFILESPQPLDEETVRSLLTDISSDAVWLNNLVENLLNMTKIQDGRLIISKAGELACDILSEASSRISKRLGKHNLEINVPEELTLVPMDGHLIIQVLVNLLDNCIKHTREDSNIVVNAYENEKYMVFEVQDNGGGIGEDIQDKIFESFVTSSKESGDMVRGMGLGLSIVKSIIEAHGGTIMAENNYLGGATFRFTLPLEGRNNE